MSKICDENEEFDEAGLRLRCVELALATPSVDDGAVVGCAQRYYDFIMHGVGGDNEKG